MARRLAADDLADPSLAALVKAGEADQEQWGRESHATLDQFRRELGRTRVQVAAAVATHQAQVSEIQRRDDIGVSTARSFVAAPDADVQLVARLPDGRPVIIDLGDIDRAARLEQRATTSPKAARWRRACVGPPL